jgi:hypothetical protein
MENRNGQMVSAQVSMFGPIPDLTESNFKLDEGSAAVKLEVIPAGAKDDNFAEITFDVGWNPEIVKEIKASSLAMLNLKFGY